jgi:phage terminase large subunit
VITIPYAPRPLQRQMHEHRKRFTVLVCHRRWGKTVWAINDLLKDALTRAVSAYRGAYIAPQLKQAKRLAWDYLKHYAREIPGVSFNESELRCDLPNGARIYLLGADNPDAIRGMYLDGVVLDEVAQMPPSLWGQVIRPLLADRNGWAVFLGTPKGHNQFWELFKRGSADDGEWMARMYRASETGLIGDLELASARKDMTDEEYEQEFECSFTAAILGAYYGKLLAAADADKRVGHVSHDPALRVSTFWDLGVSDYTSIWFAQRAGREIRLIDFYQASGAGLDHYAKVLQDKGYIYDEHFAPHDIKVRELSSAKSRLTIARGLGIEFKVVPSVSVNDGINAARLLIPRLWIDAEKCKDGLEALRQYRSEYDDRLQTLRPTPLHDWTSHAADAFRYLAVSWREQELIDQRSQGKQRAVMQYDPLEGVGGGQAETSYNLYGG